MGGWTTVLVSDRRWMLGAGPRIVYLIALIMVMLAALSLFLFH
jgi:hypothetical protein